MRTKKAYLAGPFFNEQSLLVLKNILKILETEEFEVFAPMRDGILCPKDADKKMRRKVFELDTSKLDKVDLVVALLDYPLPIDRQLILRTLTPDGLKEQPFSLPDSGTVFEMGYACARFVPIIGLTCGTGGFNLMISEACYYVATTYVELQDAIRAFKNGQNPNDIIEEKIQGDLEEL